MFRKTLCILFTLTAFPAVADDLLEPCIDGGVSASGNYPSQHIEDLVLAAAAPSSHQGESLEEPTPTEVAFPDDDEETCWVAPEWRAHPS